MPFQIIRNDLTKVKADAIVNTANPSPLIGSGTDSAIYKAAGADQLLAERQKIGRIARGDAVYTAAFNLSAKYIIHTVGPAWIDGRHGEREILHSCYKKSLALAEKLKCESIAFPLIAAGAYGFPKDEAFNIALEEIGKFLLTHEMQIILVVLGGKELELSKSLMGEINQFIDEHYVEQIREEEYGKHGYHTNSPQRIRRLRMEEERYQTQSLLVFGTMPDMTGKNLPEVLGSPSRTFQEKLFELIDERGLDDVTVYSRAGIDRRVFSSIRCKKTYQPSKKTAIAFAIALELDMVQTVDLLSRAGISLSPSSKFDLIIAYYIRNGIYDIDKIDMSLWTHNQPTLKNYGDDGIPK